MIYVSKMSLMSPFSWYSLSLPLTIRFPVRTSSLSPSPLGFTSPGHLSAADRLITHGSFTGLSPWLRPLEFVCRPNPVLSSGPLLSSCRGYLKMACRPAPNHFASGCLITLFYPGDNWTDQISTYTPCQATIYLSIAVSDLIS